MYSSTSFNHLPEVIKNLLIINCLLFLATISLENYGINLTSLLGLHQFQSPNFRPYQLITHFLCMEALLICSLICSLYGCLAKH